MATPMYGVDPAGQSKPLSVDERGRWLPSPFPYRTCKGLLGRSLDWMADNLPLTLLLVGVNAQLGVIIWLLVR